MTTAQVNTSNTTIAQSLSTALNQYETLYQQTRLVHWNVTGPHFTNIHHMTEAQYQSQATAIDDLAERIRTLGAPVQVEFSNSQLSNVFESAFAFDMLKALKNQTQTLVKSLQVAAQLASEQGDAVTEGLLFENVAELQKNLWMINCTLA